MAEWLNLSGLLSLNGFFIEISVWERGHVQDIIVWLSLKYFNIWRFQYQHFQISFIFWGICNKKLFVSLYYINWYYEPCFMRIGLWQQHFKSKHLDLWMMILQSWLCNSASLQHKCLHLNKTFLTIANRMYFTFNFHTTWWWFLSAI